MVRTGTTPIDKLELKPGLNSFIAAVSYDAVPVSTSDWFLPEKYVASYLEGMLGAAQLVGEEPKGSLNGLIYVVGDARPVHIWKIGSSSRRLAWYKKLGSPVGDKVYFIGVSLDWRGSSLAFSRTVSMVCIPAQPAVLAKYNWPDGNVIQQRDLLGSLKTSQQWLGWEKTLETAKKNLLTYESGVVDWLVPDLVPGAGNVTNLLLWGGATAFAYYWWKNESR